MLLCSGCRTKFIDFFQLPVFHLYCYLWNKYWRFYFLTCTTCIVYQYFKELVAFVLKAGAKVRGFILTAKCFRKFFYFSFQLVSQALLRKGKNNYKRKKQNRSLCESDCKDKNFMLYLPNFIGSFLFLLLSGLSLCH